ncbi:dihydrofolate reductase family protein [Cellulomonas shaoxiangyii]|uniref:Dihydrofolate reductase n=1 Tax=Cellulomonas shaoxiangyii TaxID=2566013 RepID=A0A4P7SMH4_9CELL|nr:dihydrofolate reductase family protein [Cellulomonas shaoxiangyii]QCB94426.1 dihydrofolate reductase [Cellulomonas shaoxiangyii]TGY79623.1 dihydrofolate reductase [Cellulomonas shaoxiangyii]
MAVLVSTLFLSLDGVAEVDPAWHFPYFDEQMGAGVGEDYEDADVLLLGRGTYESFAGAWPDREAEGGEDAAFAKDLGDARKIVVTRGRPELGWRNAEHLDGDLVEVAAALRADEGVRKVVVPGSLQVVRQLLAAGVLDELRLYVHPVVAGHGERLFPADGPLVPLTLLRCDPYPAGVVRLVYAPAAALPAQATYEDVREHLPQDGAA